MAGEFGWEPHFWKRLGWRELQAWIGALNRRRQGKETEPDSWAGWERDPFWHEQHRLRDERRQQGR